MHSWYIGVDNGVTGSVAILGPDGEVFYTPTPIVRSLNYTKVKAFLNRLDGTKFQALLKKEIKNKDSCFAVLERPLVNPMRWKASISAVRCLEAQLIVLELLKIPYQFLDSKVWQRSMLPSGLEGPDLKTASLEVGKRLFPAIKCKADADSLLIAEWARREGL